MGKSHQKSACCQGKIWHVNKRRRRCSVCKHSWTAWPKRRGPKPQRPSHKLLERYASHTSGSLSRQAAESSLSPQALQAKARIARDATRGKLGYPPLPTGPVLVVADALLERLSNGDQLVVYLVLVRPLDSNRAVIVPPVIRYGHEDMAGWSQALDTLPLAVRAQVKAVVCDGQTSLVSLVRRNGWVLQRCHFHLLQGLNNYVKTGRLSRSGLLAEEIHELVRVVLHSPDDQKVERAVTQLSYCAKLARSRGTRKVLSGFVKHWRDYRAYLYYDELNLPRTSGSAESCLSRIRELQYRAHGWRTEEAFLAWLDYVLKRQQYITCNRSDYIQN